MVCYWFLKRMKILPKYITRQMIITLLFTVGVFTFVLLMGRMLKQISNLLVNQHVGLEMVAYFAALMLPYVLSFTLPMATLASTLLVFGRMSADHEITAMRASGISLGRIAAPVILLATLLGGLCFYINATVTPWSRLQFRTLFLRLGIEKPMALLEEGTYMRSFPGYVIYVEHKYGNKVEDVALYTLDNDGNVVASLRAKNGIVTANPTTQKLMLDLYNVQGDLRDPKDPTNISKIRPGATAEHYPIELDLGRAFRNASQTRKLPDLMFAELLEEIRSLRAQGIYPAAALMEAHQRVAGAAACIAFALIGIPLGIKTSRRETSIGIAISLGLAVGYYFLTVMSYALRAKPHLYPEAVLWAPCVVFEVLGLWLLWRLSRV
jgi:lipopolysaccharide export system permease protein